VAEAHVAVPAAADAFDELVRRYQRMVYALALSLVRPDDADDVALGVAVDHVRANQARGRMIYHIDGVSQAKVARTLGVPEATVPAAR
jgi:DNA-directed RNA polymerase specialized sigma24 family protein